MVDANCTDESFQSMDLEEVGASSQARKVGVVVDRRWVAMLESERLGKAACGFDSGRIVALHAVACKGRRDEPGRRSAIDAKEGCANCVHRTNWARLVRRTQTTGSTPPNDPDIFRDPAKLAEPRNVDQLRSVVALE